MKLTHPRFGETRADSEQEARRLAQYGWRKAPQEKTSRKRKPVEEQPELAPEESSNPSIDL